MKKILFFSVIALCIGIFASCSSCNKNTEEKTVNPKLNVENVVSADREYMFANYGGDYKWYETTVMLNEYLDADTQDGTIQSISNRFQVSDVKDKSGDTKVITIVHNSDGTTETTIQYGHWFDDFDMSYDSIPVTFEKAFEKVMAANYVKPQSRYCVLRRQVGPHPANAQYIFGNKQSRLYVDAVTCDVSDKNPVFDE